MRLPFLTVALLHSATLLYSQDVNQNVLNEIILKANNTHSDALIIVKDGVTLYEDYYGQEEQPIYIASAGKSLVNLAIGKLLDSKLLDSLDQPVHTFYPEWKQGRKKDISIRMLLNHTSGLQNNVNASVELEPAPNYKVNNIIALALAAELSDNPGETFNYNNKAVALLGGIIEQASGKRFDHFFIDEFYKPMDITNYGWIQDESGNPTTHGAFIIKPSDFLKFGKLILNKGKHNGKQLISETWINESLMQSQEFDPKFGLLWWRFPEYEKRIIDDEIWASWEEAQVDESFLSKIAPLKNKLYLNKYDFFNDLKHLFGEDWNAVLNQQLGKNLKSSKRIYSDTFKVFYADGYRGNYLAIVPEKGIVAVRCADYQGFNYETDFFNDFVLLISQL